MPLLDPVRGSKPNTFYVAPFSGTQWDKPAPKSKVSEPVIRYRAWARTPACLRSSIRQRGRMPSKYDVRNTYPEGYTTHLEDIDEEVFEGVGLKRKMGVYGDASLDQLFKSASIPAEDEALVKVQKNMKWGIRNNGLLGWIEGVSPWKKWNEDEAAVVVDKTLMAKILDFLAEMAQINNEKDKIQKEKNDTLNLGRVSLSKQPTPVPAHAKPKPVFISTSTPRYEERVGNNSKLNQETIPKGSAETCSEQRKPARNRWDNEPIARPRSRKLIPSVSYPTILFLLFLFSFFSPSFASLEHASSDPASLNCMKENCIFEYTWLLKADEDSRLGMFPIGFKPSWDLVCTLDECHDDYTYIMSVLNKKVLDKSWFSWSTKSDCNALLCLSPSLKERSSPSPSLALPEPTSIACMAENCQLELDYFHMLNSNDRLDEMDANIHLRCTEHHCPADYAYTIDFINEDIIRNFARKLVRKWSKNPPPKISDLDSECDGLDCHLPPPPPPPPQKEQPSPPSSSLPSHLLTPNSTIFHLPPILLSPFLHLSSYPTARFALPSIVACISRPHLLPFTIVYLLFLDHPSGVPVLVPILLYVWEPYMYRVARVIAGGWAIVGPPVVGWSVVVGGWGALSGVGRALVVGMGVCDFRGVVRGVCGVVGGYVGLVYWALGWEGWMAEKLWERVKRWMDWGEERVVEGWIDWGKERVMEGWRPVWESGVLCRVCNFVYRPATWVGVAGMVLVAVVGAELRGEEESLPTVFRFTGQKTRAINISIGA